MASVVLSCFLGLALVAFIGVLCEMLRIIVERSVQTLLENPGESASTPLGSSRLERAETASVKSKTPESRSNTTISGSQQSSRYAGNEPLPQGVEPLQKPSQCRSSETQPASPCMSEEERERWRLYLMNERLNGLGQESGTFYWPWLDSF